MNFAVLFIALFFLLKKPVANALNARISGIKEQLEELEAQKAEAEKQLSEYNERLSLLDKEAEGVDSGVHQTG
jgi:F-type H+-transporting ATPase subunit b